MTYWQQSNLIQDPTFFQLEFVLLGEETFHQDLEREYSVDGKNHPQLNVRLDCVSISAEESTAG